MLNYNFKKISAFTLIVLLFFSVSVYDPSVYAKMQVMEDDHLAQIEGEAGVTLGLDLTVRSVANSISIGNGNDPGMNDFINLGLTNATSGSVFIGDGIDPSLNSSVSTNVLVDIGTSGGRTWLQMVGPAFPSSANGMGIRINQLNANIDGTIYYLGPNVTSGLPSIMITGIFMGQNVYPSVGPNLTDTSPTFMRIAAHSSGSGIDLYQSGATYIDKINWTINTAGANTSSMSVSGIYMYGFHDGAANIAQGDPTLWGSANVIGTLTQNGLIGHDATPATIDIGSNGSVNGTILRIVLPQYGDMRVRNMTIGGVPLGPPLCFDGQNVTTTITIRHLNASGY